MLAVADDVEPPPPVDPVVIVIWNVCVALAPALSVTWTMKLYDPAVVGVPLKAPLELKLKPGGRVPLATVQVYGAVPPDAVNVSEYAVPVAPD